MGKVSVARGKESNYGKEEIRIKGAYIKCVGGGAGGFYKYFKIIFVA